jgi:hypothetical protein
MRNNRTEWTELPPLPATAFSTGPAAFPLRSLQSRAAARSLIEGRETVEGEGILFEVRRVDRLYDPNARCMCKRPKAGTFALCRCF